MEPKQPPVCSSCHSATHVVPIVYGKPAESLIKKAQEGKVHLGGCCVSEDMNHFYCTSCKNGMK